MLSTRQSVFPVDLGWGTVCAERKWHAAGSSRVAIMKMAPAIFRVKAELCLVEHRRILDLFFILLHYAGKITLPFAPINKRKEFNIKRKKMIGEKKLLC